MKDLGEITVSATAAFETQLKALCIQEFPCGFGTWKAPENLSNISLKGSAVTAPPANSHAETGVQSAQYEFVEDLKELASKAPYDVDYSWSNEAKELREIAVMTPEKLNHSFILKHFKSLRIVDKKVTEIDDGLLQFQNLKHLTLSANLITRVESKRLPMELEELELSANRITDIGSLCVEPPPLIHLGLGFNLISSITGYMKPDAWGSLLSLDLSFNNLCDLVNTVNVLKALSRLRNLLLIGNPLALTPGYRGYTIDSVRQLTILDDIKISADEKHYFKGLAKLKAIPLDEAVVLVSVPRVSGVKMPEQTEDSELQSEYPKVEYKYHVQFRFLQNIRETTVTPFPAPSLPTISVVSPDFGSKKVKADGGSAKDTTGDLFKNVETTSQTWSEEAIELNYTERFHTRHLMPLRDFIKEGIEFSVIETKHSYVLEDPNVQPGETLENASAKSRPTSKLDKTKKSASKDKEKDTPAKGKDKGKAKDGKGKGKHEDLELFELPPQQKTMGLCHVALASLLEGEHVVETEGVCSGAEQGESDAEKSLEGASKYFALSSKVPSAEKKKTAKGDASDKGVKGAQRAVTPGKSKGRKDSKGKSSAKGKDEKSGKGKDKQQDDPQGEVEEEENVPPPPLVVHVHITLHNWKSASEASHECPAQSPTAAQ